MDFLTLHDEYRPGRTVYNVYDEDPVVKCLRLKGEDAVQSLRQELESGLDFDACCYGLILAAYLGNHDIVETFIQFCGERQSTAGFIESSPNVRRKRSLLNNYNDLGQTALLSAICGNHIDICQLLLVEGADINMQHQMSKETPLIVAIEHGNEDIVRLLINNGADVQLCDNVGITPLYAAIKMKNECIVRWIIDANCDVNIGSQDHSPLFMATRMGLLNIVQMLCEAGCYRDIRNKYHVTPVYEAALKGHYTVLKYLLDKNCSPNIVDMYCQSPLHVAVMSGRLQCVKLLIKSGANVKLRNHNRETPMDLSLLMGKAAIMEYFLEEGFEVVPRNENPSSLKYVIALFETGHCEAVEVLLRGCASLTMLHCIGVLPVFKNKLHLLRLLLHSGIQRIPSPLLALDTYENKQVSDWLREFRRHPRSLKDCCRLSVRRSLGNKILSSVRQLPIPNELKNYITLQIL